MHNTVEQAYSDLPRNLKLELKIVSEDFIIFLVVRIMAPVVGQLLVPFFYVWLSMIPTSFHQVK
jgi:hypothetical protein